LLARRPWLRPFWLVDACIDGLGRCRVVASVQRVPTPGRRTVESYGSSHCGATGGASVQAAARPEASGSPVLALDTTSPHDTFIEASDITFRYRTMGEPVLYHCSLRIGPGDRILLEGPSGGGKSTFASILSGMLRPQSGLLLARGLDRQTLGGKAWRRSVAAAPQFHENHVLTGTFAFNLLMGREGWITQKDHAEAQAVCEELGLGPLLEKMPAGMLPNDRRNGLATFAR